jgi:hypothetical protein
MRLRKMVGEVKTETAMLGSEQREFERLEDRVRQLEKDNAEVRGELKFANHVVDIRHQQGRFESDIESEKGSRARANSETTQTLAAMDARLRVVERSVWLGTGGIIAVQIAIAYFSK